MFTGLVEEMGDVIGLVDARLTVAARLVLEDSAGRIPILISDHFLQDMDFLRHLAESGQVTVVGVASVDARRAPLAGDYRLMPRDPADFEFPFLIPYREVAFGSSVLTILIAAAVENAQQFGLHAVVLGGRTIGPSVIVNEQEFGSPRIRLAAKELAPNRVANATLFGNPAIAPGNVPHA